MYLGGVTHSNLVGFMQQSWEIAATLSPDGAINRSLRPNMVRDIRRVGVGTLFSNLLIFSQFVNI
jgi:hypothetical protein